MDNSNGSSIDKTENGNNTYTSKLAPGVRWDDTILMNIVMDKTTFTKKVALWVAAIAAILMLIIGLCFGKVIEESLFAEVAKWVVMSLFVIGILEGFVYFLGPLIWHFTYDKQQPVQDQQSLKGQERAQPGMLEDSCASETCAYRGKGVCKFKDGDFCPMYINAKK